MTERIWNKDSIVNLVTTNDKALVRALMVVYNNQTQSEQAVEATTEQNGIGFTSFDAEMLTSFAKFAIRNGFLTEAQMVCLRSRITKYWKQLLQAAETKGGAVDYKVSRAKKEPVAA